MKPTMIWIWAAFLGLCSAGSVPGANFYCDPEKGSMQGDGSAAKPWRTIQEVVAARLIQVRNAQGQVANSNAPVAGGDTLWLRSGWHGIINIRSGHNADFITIAAAAGHTPLLGWVNIGGGTRWRLKGLTISPALAPVPLEKPPRNLVQLGEHGDDTCEALEIEECFVYSVLDATGWTASDWVTKPLSGIWLGRHGRRHVARNNFILNTRFGINLCAEDAICEGNVVANFSGDGIRVTRDGQVVRHNIVKNNFVGARDGDDNHDDAIQAFLFSKGRGIIRRVTIAENLVIARERDDLPFPNPLQGIGFFDGPLVQFKVENNVVLVNHYHGITLGDAQNSLIQSNACFSRWADQKPKPWIMLSQKQKSARGNTMRDNWAHSFSSQADAEVQSANNQAITEKVFREKMAALLGQIEARYGRSHPVARLPRVNMPWLQSPQPGQN